ncbi:hypothetical protein WH50_23455 [Pokkaliibacter plantistimulans]|uniref:Uncharacterized protein n=1 Tax=Pokkaliibacter plantistimulans TaxID=1635171 RepID=A0ABX5LRZ4_9GAMM|nr:hypothetical protein [Pokkaliibacter plantistimulans]PXF28949.1 hypothetical protein WH50_23455 [Pokkaliibacter plantistimulans]
MNLTIGESLIVRQMARMNEARRAGNLAMFDDAKHSIRETLENIKFQDPQTYQNYFHVLTHKIEDWTERH